VGNPLTFRESIIGLRRGQARDRDELLASLVAIQYARNDRDAAFGTFRVRGDTVEVRAAFEERVLRIEFFGDEVEALTWVEPLTGRALEAVGPRPPSTRPPSSWRPGAARPR